jgi:Transcriptional regulator, AbiEi antitoxin/Protein of unknown function (DUF559)
MPTRGADWLIAGLANRQYGVVGRRQLLAAGIGRRAIAVRLKAGRLHRIHPGVYSVGHLIVPREGKWMAAVLAGGEGAVLSHSSAAVLWGLRKGAGVGAEITTQRSTRSYGSLRRHCSTLPPDEVTFRHRIPVTTVSRTLFDLAATMPPAEFERAMREAEVLRLPERPPLPDLLVRYPGRRGAHTVRSTLERLSRLPGGVTRSPLEDRFLRLATRVGLPMPETNVTVILGDRRYEADCLWREQRLILELDGHEVHRTRAAFEGDRERDRRLQAAGWIVVRATSRQLDQPIALAKDLRTLLALPRRESA